MECCSWPNFSVALRWIATLTWVQPQAFKQQFTRWGHSSFTFLSYHIIHIARLGAVALTVLVGQLSCATPQVLQFGDKLGGSQLRQLPGGHQWCHIEVGHLSLLNNLASFVSWSPPNAVHHWECPLLAFAVEAAIQDALGDRAIRAPGSGSAGSSSPHSLALSATCIYLVRGQKVANHHCKDLVLLSCAYGTANWVRAVNATCAWIWQFSLGDICCTNKMHQHSWCQAAMLEREGRRDSHWRQPWTSDSLALGSEIKIRNHPCSGCFIAGLSKSAIYTIRVVRNFPYHKPSQAFWVYPLRGFISHHVGEPPKCW